MSESFFITLFYDIFLLKHIFNIFRHFVIRGGAGDHRKAYLFFLHTICFSQNAAFSKKQRRCQKNTTLFQKSHNQQNCMLKMHLRSTSRDSMSYVFDKWPNFPNNTVFQDFSSNFGQKTHFPEKMAHFGSFWVVLGHFFNFDPLFQVFRFLQPHDMYTFSESPGSKLSYKL